MVRGLIFSAEFFGPHFLTVSKAFKIKPKRGTNISNILFWGFKYFDIFGPGETNPLFCGRTILLANWQLELGPEAWLLYNWGNWRQ